MKGYSTFTKFTELELHYQIHLSNAQDTPFLCFFYFKKGKNLSEHKKRIYAECTLNNQIHQK